MNETPRKVLWKADEIAARGKPFKQRLNPNSEFIGAGLSRMAGMSRAHVTLARLPAGKDSFAYHAHMLEEEWVYILSGRGVAEIDGESHEVGPGDFMGFATPSVPPQEPVRGRAGLSDGRREQAARRTRLSHPRQALPADRRCDRHGILRTRRAHQAVRCRLAVRHRLQERL